MGISEGTDNFVLKLVIPTVSKLIGRPVFDKGTSVVTLTTATTAAMFPNADDHLGNWVENPSQYN